MTTPGRQRRKSFVTFVPFQILTPMDTYFQSRVRPLERSRRQDPSRTFRQRRIVLLALGGLGCDLLSHYQHLLHARESFNAEHRIRRGTVYGRYAPVSTEQAYTPCRRDRKTCDLLKCRTSKPAAPGLCAKYSTVLEWSAYCRAVRYSASFPERSILHLFRLTSR